MQSTINKRKNVKGFLKETGSAFYEFIPYLFIILFFNTIIPALVCLFAGSIISGVAFLMVFILSAYGYYLSE